MDAETILESRHIYVGDRIAVRHERVRLLDGMETTRDIINHPDTVVILPVDSENNVILVRQYRPAAKRTLLELPAGAIDSAESPVVAAQRELREETGYAAVSLNLLGTFYSVPGMMTELLYCYIGRNLYIDPLPSDVDERIRVERLTFRQVLTAAREGLIQDAKSLASLFLAEPELGDVG